MGRLFDAVACLAGIRNEVTYEAQAAMELEVLSKPYLATAKQYPFELDGDIIRVSELLRQIIADVRSRKPAGWIGARFHQTLASLALEVSKRMQETFGIQEVALSGGVWQNQVLLDLAHTALIQHKFTVYTHQQTPANDGGLALGQAVVAGFKIQNGGTHVS